MTVQEIKETVRMSDLFAGYGIAVNRNGFALCPFHSERTPSCRVYNDSFYCFGCHAGGDAFTFVEKMERCGFREAFRMLGGTDPDKPLTDLQIIQAARRRRRAAAAAARLTAARSKYIAVCQKLDRYRKAMQAAEPFSSEWCTAGRVIEQTAYFADCARLELEEAEGRNRHGSDETRRIDI